MDSITINKTELKNARLLYVLMSVLLIVDWVLPQYFGVHIGFDFTGTRIMNIIIIVYFLFNRKAGNHFLRSMLEVQMTPYLAMYMFVMIYTTILRVNVNTFFLNSLDILTFYMVYYGIRYCIGVAKAIEWTVRIAWFLGIYGIIEYVLGDSPMINYLKTLPSAATVVYRSGQYRIMGSCVHAIGYGMMLLILLAIICIDYEKDEINLLRHPVLYLILILNVFLTGSRGPLGLAAVETVLLVLFSNRKARSKTILIGILMLLVVVVAEIGLLASGSSLGNYIMMQITSIIDSVFGTSFSLNYGADLTWLGQSSSYRKLLPKVFTADGLNPLLGQGANASRSFEFDGVYVVSIDNFYVALYIRYAYPGLITFVLFEFATLFFMFRTGFRYHSGVSYACAVGFLMYGVSLLWVDYLQTTKYMYILVAIYAAYYTLNHRQIEEAEKYERRENRL